MLLGRTGAIDAGAGPGDVTMVTVNASGLDTGIVSAVVLGTGSTGKETKISVSVTCCRGLAISKTAGSVACPL